MKSEGMTKVFLAGLPVLFFIQRLEQAVIWGLGLFAMILATGIVRRLAAAAFPQDGVKPALFMWLGATAQAAWYLLHVIPLWVLSVCVFNEALLGSKRSECGLGVLAARALGVLALLCFVGLMREVLVLKLGVLIFDHPAGNFLILAAAALLWQNQPGKKPAV